MSQKGERRGGGVLERGELITNINFQTGGLLESGGRGAGGGGAGGGGLIE